MKKINTKIIAGLFVGLLTTAITATASVVSQDVAQKVATNFYKQTFGTTATSTTLAYLEKDASGNATYYVFDVNTKDGFVIVSAENAGSPIIGYSNVGQYVVPTANNNMDFWMKKRSVEIEKMRSLHLSATNQITNKWNAYINNTAISANSSGLHSTSYPSVQSSPFPSSTNYLVQSTWDQYNEGSTTICAYNCLCPGGSVTGCVATTMAQIMRYWQYPAKGTGSSSYNSGSYGTLSANYGTTHYHYTNMPLTNPTSETDIDTLMYQAGVSVRMSYSPSGSGAFVITSDDAIACAQISYVTYFGYSSAILHGLNAYSNATTWQDTLEKELDHSRPIEYVGTDPSDGGHTWVCDGYNSANDFHMNWGWSGYDDGWYALNNLNAGGSDFTQNIEALIGIMPPANALPNANFDNTLNTFCAGTTVNFTNFSSVNATSWNWTFSGGTPATSSLQNPTGVVYNTPGTYSVSLKVSNSNGSSTFSKTLTVGANTAEYTNWFYSEGFESWASVPNTDWSVENPDNDVTWAINSSAAYDGSNCVWINNTTDVAGKSDALISPAIDLTKISNPTMTFYVAYTQESSTTNDNLKVYFSTNCGQTWSLRYNKSGATLATSGVQTSAFTPTSGQWREESIPLSLFSTDNDVRIKFLFTSDAGNNIYIDNINISGPTGVSEHSGQQVSLAVYPNPLTNNSVVSFTLPDKENVALNIYDILGRKVSVLENAELGTGTHYYSIQKSTLKQGVYFVEMVADGHLVVQKLLVD